MNKYIDNNDLKAVGESVVGRVRAANEDFCGYQSTDNGELFVVCDGMGGHVGGAEASKTAVSYIIKTLAEQKYDEIHVALKKALVEANRAVYEKGRQNPSLSGMGTTACILMVKDGKAWIAHVGDSRIYLFTAKDKTLHRITKDHSYVQSLVDLGQLDDRDAESHPRKNVILKALGIKESLSVEVEQMPVLPSDGDIFLICSDGLSGMVDDNCLESILRSNSDIEAALQAMIEDANAPDKGTDNITAQLIQVRNVNREFSEFPDYNPVWRRQMMDTTTKTLDFGWGTQVAVPRRKRTPVWVWILLGVVSLLLIAGTSYYFYRMHKAKNESVSIEVQIKTIKEEISDLKSQISNLEEEIKKANEDAEKVKKEAGDIGKSRREELQKLNDQKAKLEDKKKSKIARLDELNELKAQEQKAQEQKVQEPKASTDDGKAGNDLKNDEGGSEDIKGSASKTKNEINNFIESLGIKFK